MKLLVREIKEMGNTELIGALCRNMLDETNNGALTRERICKELEKRGVISSASYLNDRLSR